MQWRYRHSDSTRDGFWRTRRLQFRSRERAGFHFWRVNYKVVSSLIAYRVDACIETNRDERRAIMRSSAGLVRDVSGHTMAPSVLMRREFTASGSPFNRLQEGARGAGSQRE